MYNYGPAAYNWSRLTAAAGHAAHAAHLKTEWPTSADYVAASLQQHSDFSHHYAAAHYNMTGEISKGRLRFVGPTPEKPIQRHSEAELGVLASNRDSFPGLPFRRPKHFDDEQNG